MAANKTRVDFESSGAQEWTLPGYGKQGYYPSQATAKTGTDQSIPDGPKPTPDEFPKQPPAAPGNKGTLSTPVRPAVVPRPARGRGGYRGRIGRSSGVSPKANLFGDSPAKSKWRGKLEPTGLVKLPAPFGTFKNEFFGIARLTGSIRKPPGAHGRYEVFEEISRRTGAFIKPPFYNDNTIYLWGEPFQVAAAKVIILTIVAKCSNAGKKKVGWEKIMAHSVSKEARVELKERYNARLQILQKQPDSSSEFSDLMLFLWPKEGPSITESLGPHLEALDHIRVKFNCHVFVPKDLPNHICAMGHNDEAMRQIVRRLRTKWTEVVANYVVKGKLYLVEPPTAMKSKIVVKKDARLAKPLLRGTPLQGSEAQQWPDRASLIQSKNNARLLSMVERCLKGVVVVRGHLRMRVNLGSFVLDQYRIPADDKPYYVLEEFREMILHEQTKGRLIPGLKVHKDELLARCYRATHLLQPYLSTAQSLSSAEPAFSVNFEFLGQSNSMLRLEAEFARSPGASEYETTQRRWLKPRQDGQSSDKRPPLQVAVVDFEKSDWQLELKSLEFYQASSIDAALRDFAGAIKFKSTATMHDISAMPERKVEFSQSAPVARFIEKSAIRYKIKGTNYTLEIARYDEYSRANASALSNKLPASYAGPFTTEPNTSWGASLFDPHWDNLLGEHANLAIGHAAQYDSSLESFFPARGAGGNSEKSQGFWAFVDTVKQVAGLMGPVRTTATSSGEKSRLGANSAMSVKPTTVQGRSSDSSPVMGMTDLAGLLNADLGTLF
ncbi:uncharacterized protein BO87DRAFT_402856 [Aspergillus neoniger CBS 115656]|uniref:DUF7905 domain-containing protein n=1 Tax=Aspergillus neoniger (strain CBS 115656) TaxID=1448310 RepID=A0A318Z0M0_ASPNB|nr:hypothetical protein BO87DRAFT_402856 [Aspergillus neoniger CBS 115656]PYH39924.1 hypothetical protein BO87DRAFT_402856 [Aspergillus neoniger CBS 115656]